MRKAEVLEKSAGPKETSKTQSEVFGIQNDEAITFALGYWRGAVRS